MNFAKIEGLSTQQVYIIYITTYFILALHTKENCLCFDHCFANSPAQVVVKDNVCPVYLLSNCTLLIQPIDHGILHVFKCKSSDVFQRKMLDTCKKGTEIETF